jgi:ubiquinone/menaquinone biosynthesis C-methylase UbiE
MDTTQLHTGKAVHYDLYRPTYPKAALAYLADAFDLKGKTIADVGCGTGILTRQLSPFVQKIYAIEPNQDMVRIFREHSAPFGNISIIETSAEQTTLDAQSLDLITAATSFHWFDLPAFHRECLRVLRSKGKIALLVNSPGHRNNVDVLKLRGLCNELGVLFSDELYRPLVGLQSVYEFFKGCRFVCRKFANDLLLSREQFLGRYLSMHYAPKVESESYIPFKNELRAIFDECHEGGTVLIPNKTLIFAGSIA